MVHTIGHSIHSLEVFVEWLVAHGSNHVADVRKMPRSRRHPHFSIERLPRALAAAEIGYSHWPELGGLRTGAADSMNAGWRNASFRAFADYMQTEEFSEAIDRLRVLAGAKQVAILCAESVPWRCHRSLICDALVARGVIAEHIINANRRNPHVLTPFAPVEGTRVTYPAKGHTEETDQQRLFDA